MKKYTRLFKTPKKAVPIGLALIIAATSAFGCNCMEEPIEIPHITTPYETETPTITYLPPDTVEPTPTTETPVEEPTFEDMVLAELQKYHRASPQSIYSSETLDNMLSFAENNKSKISDYDSRHFYILTEFIKDNPGAANHATAVDQYVREIDDMIFDYCRIGSLNDKIEGYNGVAFNEDVFVRDLVNLNWSNFLPFMESGEAKEGEFSLLPEAPLLTNLVERVTGSEINPERYNGNDVNLRPHLLEIFYQNVLNFQTIRDSAKYVVDHPDYFLEVTGKYTTKERLLSWIDNHISETSSIQTKKDIEALLDGGSESTKKWLKLYASNMHMGRNPSRYEENRVELTIGDIWTLPEIGLKPYRISADRLIENQKRSGHGEIACNTKEEDLELLRSNSNEEILILSSPYGGNSSINILWLRIRLAKDDDSIEKIEYVIDDRG